MGNIGLKMDHSMTATNRNTNQNCLVQPLGNMMVVVVEGEECQSKVAHTLEDFDKRIG